MIQNVNAIVSEELSKAYNEIMEYTQFKLSKAVQTITGRVVQELLNKRNEEEKGE